MALTSLGPVFTSRHSVAVSLIFIRGSNQDTPKYMEMDMVWNRKEESEKEREKKGSTIGSVAIIMGIICVT